LWPIHFPFFKSISKKATTFSGMGKADGQHIARPVEVHNIMVDIFSSTIIL
jgi:hypothetical protein